MKVERKLNYFADKVFMNGEMGKEIRLFDMLELIIQKHSKALNDSLRFYNKYYDDAAKTKRHCTRSPRDSVLWPRMLW